MSLERRTNLKKGESKLETHALKNECSDRGTWMFVFRYEGVLLVATTLSSRSRIWGVAKTRSAVVAAVAGTSATIRTARWSTASCPRRPLGSLHGHSIKSATKGQRGKELNWHPYLLSIQLLRRLPRSRWSRSLRSSRPPRRPEPRACSTLTLIDP